VDAVDPDVLPVDERIRLAARLDNEHALLGRCCARALVPE
jgi:hypothetical protein